jgi:NAD(P)-dependent dehydrogenase (short-subunit alcohol dehydrogenase family)
MAARVAVVTGGTGGLGETISTKLHDKGYTVVVTYSPGNRVVTDLLAEHKSKGYNFHAYKVDVADFDSCQASVAKIHSDVGGSGKLIGANRSTWTSSRSEGEVLGSTGLGHRAAIPHARLKESAKRSSGSTAGTRA